MRDPNRPVVLAVIAGAHGLGGDVRLKLFGEGVDALKRYKRFNDGALSLSSIRADKGGAIARFAEIADRSGAERARGTELTVPRSALPPLTKNVAGSRKTARRKSPRHRLLPPPPKNRSPKLLRRPL